MKRMTGDERRVLVDNLLLALDRGEITLGKMLKQLRLQLTEMNQDEFAALVGVSRRTLSEIERDLANPSMDTVNRVYRPFALKLTLVPRRHPE